MMIYSMVLPSVELAPAAEYEIDMGCIDTEPTRRCFTLYRIEWSWSDAATQCSETADSRLAVIDRQCDFIIYLIIKR